MSVEMNVCRVSCSSTSRSVVGDLCKTNKLSQSEARGGGMHESSKRARRNGRSSIMFNAANKRLQSKVRTASAVIMVLTTINGNAANIFVYILPL